MITAASVFSALVAFVKAIPIVDAWVQQFIAWYVVLQTQKTRQQIVDAASLAARAPEGDAGTAQRYEASAAWQKALQRPKVTT